MQDVMSGALGLAERETRWMDLAACRGMADSVNFYPEMPRDPSKAERARYADDVARAQRVCADCPVINECLEDAMDRDETHGIWGGRDFHVPWNKRLSRVREAS